MSKVTVEPVSTRRQRKLFLELPWQIYRNDPNWIPPIRMDQEELVGYRKHPFYEKNRVETFLAYRDGAVCGRIAAILNRVYIDYQKDRRGFFGFFECLDDQEAADALFAAVRQWFALQGIEKLRGPANPSMNYTLGLLVEGFDSPPTFMMTYNPPHYGRLIERAGFGKCQDLYAYYGYKDMLPESSAKLGPISEQIVERFDIRVRTLDRSRFLEDVEAFLDVYNRSMVRMWGFSPMSPAEVRHIAKGLRWLLVPELTAAAEIDGKLIGASFALLDYNPRIKQIDGRLFPFGFLRLLWNRKKIKRIRLVSANVIPEYQLMGVGLVLLRSMVPNAVEWGLEEVEYSWVLESNLLSRGSIEKGGAKRLKTYRLYDWEPTA